MMIVKQERFQDRWLTWISRDGINCQMLETKEKLTAKQADLKYVEPIIKTKAELVAEVDKQIIDLQARKTELNASKE